MNASSVVVGIAWLTLGQAAAQPPADAKPAWDSANAIEIFKTEAAGYVVRLESRPRDKLTVEKEPALRWSNPARTGEDGALFFWTLNGRPELIGTMFTYRLNDKINRKHEFHSLATGPMTAEFRGKEVWTPRTAGVTFEPLPGAPDVATTPRQRLTQMKALARDFSASLVDAEGESFELRLLTQPLIRYEPKDKDVLDGAVFAFSLGTDPEVLLLLEARAAGDAHQWQHGLVRFHFVDLQARYKDKEVWHAEKLPNINNLNLGAEPYRDSPYTTYHVERGIPAE